MNQQVLFDLREPAERVRERVARGSTVILSCSGGKDSTATGLVLKELGIPFQAIFCDTGWEHQDTYRYLREDLPGILGPITWLRCDAPWPDKIRLPMLRRENVCTKEEIEQAERAEALRMRPILEAHAVAIEQLLEVNFSPLVRRALTKATMPARVLRWCTQELKFFPARDFLATLDDPINVVGIRHEESKARSEMPEWERDEGLDCDVWRPIIRFTLDDVIAIHKRHGVTPNPLYLKNASRVGCYPCIFSRKFEISVLDDRRIEAIRMLEAAVAELAEVRIRRAGNTPEHLPPTFFQSEEANPDGSYAWPIDEVIAWSRSTPRGPRKGLPPLMPRDAGCMRWGLCDTSVGDRDL